MNAPLDLIERLLGRARASSDIVLAGVMAMIIAAMIVPLPAWLLDLGLAFNLAAALALLVAALSARDALRVATFPTLLLLTTLFRLAMNVSSTRLALSEGHAGEIIEAFGEFVVRGDYVVGAVIFAILTLVQFLVVTKGAERVAEVSARFTLDAMPGKQMSIDADLRAGAISQEQARSRRRELERESQLFGSMDGAMKFVKGDVIAGLVITLVNLVGGTLIGVLQGGLPVSEAASTYALIAIGDGLVSQLPSLAIAVAAGLVVTRVAAEQEDTALGAEIGAQFFGQHRALFVVAVLCLALAALPGMPTLTFGLIALALTGIGFALQRLRARPANQAVTPTPASSPAPRSEPLTSTGVAPLTLDLAADLSPLLEEDDQAFVKEDLDAVRERVHRELGVKLPTFRVRTGCPLAPRSYQLAVDEVPSGRGQLPEGALFALGPVGAGEGAVPAVDALGRAVTPVPVAEREALGGRGIPLRTRRALLVDHLVALAKKRASAFLGVQEVQAALTELERTSPALVKEALHKVPLPLLTDVLKRLLVEQVSIRNLRALLEALVSPATEGDAAQLAERCRVALGRQLSHHFAQGGPLLAYLVDPAVEEALRQGSQGLAPADASAILEGVKRVARQGRAVLLASPDVRRLLRRLVEGAYPDVAVLTYAELDPELQVRPVGRLVAAPAAA